MSEKIKMQDELIKKRTTEVIESGYNERDFDDSYWLDQFGTVPRYMRGSINIINYFEDFWGKIGIAKGDEGTFIDICAGAGNCVNEFRQHGIDAYGCEFSSSGRRVARQKFDIVLSECDLREPFTYPDNSFDWGCCIAAISMIPRKDMANAIKEICRITKYGILLHVATAAGEMQDNEIINPHHLTGMSHDGYASIFNGIDMHDLTGIHCASDERYGIGTNSEFTRLYSKYRINELIDQFGGEELKLINE